jgi:hypothetical protein
MERPMLETLGLHSLLASKEKAMNVWSDYLRTQAILADRISKTMTTAATVKEFADYAESYRQDADAEDIQLVGRISQRVARTRVPRA